MAKTVSIKNFRCFEAANLQDCRRINVIVGDNGSGKTALMEAIFLAAAASPEIVFRLRQWRGFDSSSMTGSPRILEKALWGDLFNDYDFKKTISIGLTGSRTHTREVTINYQERNIIVPTSKKSEEAGWSPVNFTYKGPNNRTLANVTPRLLRDGKVEFPPTPQSPLESAFFAASHNYSSAETAQRFSELSKRELHHDVIEHFKQLFPNVIDLSIELNAGTAMLHAQMANSDKVPLTSLSGGMNKLASVLFAIPTLTKGILLIDELESGFYYRRLPQIWRALLLFAERYDVQVFASTHGIECLDAAADVAEDAPEKFSVIHTGLQEKIKQFPGEKFTDAMRANLEIR